MTLPDDDDDDDDGSGIVISLCRSYRRGDGRCHIERRWSRLPSTVLTEWWAAPVSLRRWTNCSQHTV